MSDQGEPSRKTPSDQNDSSKPFKKARYVWQLKGKYHLKDSANKQPRSGSSASNHNEHIINPNTRYSSDSDSDEEATNNNNSAINNNNTVCKERCCIDDLLTHSNALLDNDESESELSANNIEKSISDEIPVTLVKPNIKNHDEFLHKWQARQMAKSFVDNTINSILEHWKIAPFDPGDFVENCEAGEHVEDEGILMAIQSHGLQSGMRHSAPNSNFPPAEASRHHEPSMRENMVTSALDNLENSQMEMIKTETMEDSDESLEIDDPMEFLNAAVSVAIQKKGLSSYNYG